MKKLCLLVTLLFLSPLYAQKLLIATTLSTEAMAYIIEKWQQVNPDITVKTLNRTSTSIERLISSPFSEQIDLVITSSPMLLAHLKNNNMLSPMTTVPKESRLLTPSFLQQSVATFAISGYGILSNQDYLQQHQLPIPTNWQDLTLPEYYGSLSMSTPSRSDTTHLMIELLLQKYGWQRGWQILLEMGGNIGTISSRSFGVVDKINSELSIIGMTIDNYAITNNNDKLTFRSLTDNIPIPTFVTILKNSQHKTEAQHFIDYLLSNDGQLAVSNPKTGKSPIIVLQDNSTNPSFLSQQFKQMDYELLLRRQALIQQLFDIAITFRLQQLKESWKLLHDTEKKLGKQLPEVRQLLTSVPPLNTEELNDGTEQAKNKVHDGQINAIEWKTFFQQQNKMAMKLLENL